MGQIVNLHQVDPGLIRDILAFIAEFVSQKKINTGLYLEYFEGNQVEIERGIVELEQIYEEPVEEY